VSPPRPWQHPPEGGRRSGTDATRHASREAIGMKSWTCPQCGEDNGETYDLCWNCGTRADGTAASPDFVREVPLGDPASGIFVEEEDEDWTAASERELACLRCGEPMRTIGRKRFHEGTRAWPFMLGNLGELFVNRESFDVLACAGCGKVEFFVTAAPRRED
jgi:hypothetical protein